MRIILRIILIGFITTIVLSTCKKKDEKICPNNKNCNLSFGQDTVFFDTTVFTGVKTITKRLYVYNFNDYAININQISIPADSPFKLIIQGERTNTASDIKLRGNDSMLILIEAIFGENNADSIQIVEEDLKFHTDKGEEIVKLVAPTLDVYFHNSEVLDCDAIWQNDHPHLIYNSVLVPKNCTLTIEPGVSVFSHPRSAILVEGSILAEGTKDSKILFTDDRVDHPDTYDDIFGIWEGILILAGSSNNKFEWVRINNAVNGIRVNYFNKYDIDDNGKLIIDPDYTVDMSGGTYELEFSHSIINTIGNNVNAPSFTGGLPFSGIGIIGRNCDMIVHNSLVTNCTVGSMMVLLNGTYQIFNNTFANYPTANASFNRPKEVRTFYASTILADASGFVEGGTMDLQLINNIIYGENSATEPEDNLDELTLSSTADYQFGDLTGVFNNVIKTSEFDTLLMGSNIINKNPFVDTITYRENYDFTIETNSPAKDEGFNDLSSILPGISNLNIDLAGNYRDNFWDIGAYEYIP